MPAYKVRAEVCGTSRSIILGVFFIRRVRAVRVLGFGVFRVFRVWALRLVGRIGQALINRCMTIIFTCGQARTWG